MHASNQSVSRVADAGALPDLGAADGEHAAGLTQFISFAIGDDQYGVDIIAVREIKGWSRMTEPTPLHVVIVVQIGSQMVGLLADRVLDIVGFTASQVQPVPRISQGARSDFLSGLVTIESGMIALIDLSRILSVSSDDPAEITAVEPRPATLDGQMIAPRDLPDLPSPTESE
jgi:purine-binding chemotaxis protein CheW